MQSLKEFYKQGNGPSSSHTMGPKKAAEMFKKEYKKSIQNDRYLESKNDLVFTLLLYFLFLV